MGYEICCPFAGTPGRHHNIHEEGRMKTAKGIFLAATLGLLALPVFAQDWPTRPVRIIVPFAAGGGTDIVARAVAAKLSETWKQQVLVDNRPGGGTNIGTELVVQAVPDGYTLLMGGASNAINMSLMAKPPYNTLRDLVPMAWCTQGAPILAAHPSLPVRNLKELIAMAKKMPGQLNYGHAGLGSANHLAGELFTFMAKVRIEHVPYKGNTPSITDALAGHVHLVMSGVPALLPHIRASRLRPLAIGSKARFPAVPDLPTFDESGVTGFEASNWFGLMAPRKTANHIVNKINTDANKALAGKDLQDRFLKEGLIAKNVSASAFEEFVRAEIDKYAGIIKRAGIKPR